MTIKKQFVELVEFLQANENKKVSTILPQILEMVSAKVPSKTFHKIDDEVVAVFCYYHKRWELVSQVEYGTKSSTASGLNTMCKVGVNQWTKQQREAKAAKEKLLEQVAGGELEASELPERLELIEEQRLAPVFTQEFIDMTYSTLEEALDNL